MAQPEMVYIKHPDVDAIGHVVRSAFDGIHRAKGWEIAGPDDYEILTDDEGQDRPVPSSQATAAFAQRVAAAAKASPLSSPAGLSTATAGKDK